MSMQDVLRLLLFLAGLWLVIWTLLSAIRAFVLPRSENVLLVRIVFVSLFTVFRLRIRGVLTYEERDRVMAMFAPLGLLLIPVFCLLLILTGYSVMFWAAGIETVSEALIISGSSLFTLGFAREDALRYVILTFSEATIGLGLVALLISYLPTMYSAFAQRERAIAMLEVRAGEPPSAVEMLKRYNRLQNLPGLAETYADWEMWFAQLEESHSSLAPLIFFRSQLPARSWVTASGAILDSASLYLSCIDDSSAGYRAALAIRSGYMALRRIGDFLGISYEVNPQPGDPISIERSEFEMAYYELLDAGVPVKADLDQAWHDFAGWRVNYDTVLIELAALTMAPYAPWSSDRSLTRMREDAAGNWRQWRRRFLFKLRRKEKSPVI